MQYALIKNTRVENVIVADADADFITAIAADWDHIEALDTLHEQGLGVGIGWTWSAEEGFTPPPAPELPAPAPQPRHITQLAFLNRFTDPEAINIDLASQGATPQAAAMRRYLSKINAASYIDLDRSDTRAGVQQLEAVGLLATGRAAEILDAPVQESERYRGG